ncbi:hypothetical protein SAMN04487944_11826 [Gracilibacillus ureilyticus]|uniref:Uncharacterized protein n=1 Tax=Gracilibacillus ureilyticus TaxID=531814 RepID=A0A1H9UL47_9BACI|nr:hypothetical protein SAMN04487944_11826 [Gracilibacillus ureilyticus]
MNAEILMLVVTLIIGYSLCIMVFTKRGSVIMAFYLWFIQLVVVLVISIFMLNLGVIDIFTSTFGLITILMLILVLTYKKIER